MRVEDFLMQTGNFKMIDRITSIEYMKFSEAEKEVGPNEFWVKDHFPGYPIFPGVLLLEAMGQTGGLLLHDNTSRKKYGYLNKVNNFKLLKPVFIGDKISIKAKFICSIGTFSSAHVSAYVKNNLVASAEITYALPDTRL